MLCRHLVMQFCMGTGSCSREAVSPAKAPFPWPRSVGEDIVRAGRWQGLRRFVSNFLSSRTLLCRFIVICWYHSGMIATATPAVNTLFLWPRSVHGARLGLAGRLSNRKRDIAIVSTIAVKRIVPS